MSYQITEEQFRKAQAIIDEYHRERQQKADHDLDEDEYNQDFDHDDDDFDPYDSRYGCRCGAWEIGKLGNLIHVADCICGAE